jgi:hypothetical protein
VKRCGPESSKLTAPITDMDRDNVIDWAGPDRIRATLSDVITDFTTTVRRTRNYIYIDGSTNTVLLNTMEASSDGLRTWNTGVGSLVTSSQTVYGGSNTRTVTVTAPDNSTVVTTYVSGRVDNVVCAEWGHQLWI